MWLENSQSKSQPICPMRHNWKFLLIDLVCELSERIHNLFFGCKDYDNLSKFLTILKQFDQWENNESMRKELETGFHLFVVNFKWEACRDGPEDQRNCQNGDHRVIQHENRLLGLTNPCRPRYPSCPICFVFVQEPCSAAVLTLLHLSFLYVKEYASYALKVKNKNKLLSR